MLPSSSDILASAHVVSLPLRQRFRGIETREVMLFEGPQGWTEFSPFVEYGDEEAAAWLAAAIDFGWNETPPLLRDSVRVNATLPAVSADRVADVLDRFPGCRTIKVKVAETGQTLAASGKKIEHLDELQLMTSKPFIYVFNTDDAGLADTAFQDEMRALVAPADAIFLDAQFESELVELEPDEAREMLADNGQEEAGLDQLARVGFHTLGLQSYLTAGPKESRAWTIHQGWTAPQAAGVIHTDFQRGFIKAEVVGFEDLIAAGSMAEAKSKGKVRIEGKDYVMADGDVVEFRFNV